MPHKMRLSVGCNGTVAGRIFSSSEYIMAGARRLMNKCEVCAIVINVVPFYLYCSCCFMLVLMRLFISYTHPRPPPSNNLSFFFSFNTPPHFSHKCTFLYLSDFVSVLVVFMLVNLVCLELNKTGKLLLLLFLFLFLQQQQKVNKRKKEAKRKKNTITIQ